MANTCSIYRLYYTTQASAIGRQNYHDWCIIMCRSPQVKGANSSVGEKRTRLDMERSHHVLSSPWVQAVLVGVLVLLQSANHGATAPISIRDCSGINLRPCYDGPPLRKSVVSLPRCCWGLEKILGRGMGSTHESTCKCIYTALSKSSRAGLQHKFHLVCLTLFTVGLFNICRRC